MTILDQIQSRYRDDLLPRLPAPWRELLQGNSFRQLLAGAESELLLYGDTLFDLRSGQSASLNHDDAEAVEPDAQNLARAASRLVEEGAKLALYLSPSEFVGTQYKLPGMSREAAQSALGLQSDALFPGVDQELAIAVAGHLGSDDDAVALWLPNERLDALFAAFNAAGLFLLAVAPRVLALTDGAVVDSDAQGDTLALISSGAVSRYLHISKLDLQDEVLSQEFTEAVARHEDGGLLRATSGADYIRQRSSLHTATEDSGEKTAATKTSIPSHVFVPAAAMQARKKVEQRRSLGLLAVAGVAVLALAVLPFVSQSLEFRSLASTLAKHREQSVEARTNQAVVVEFENEWGVINDFPEQDVPESMFNLQGILLPDQLASLELAEGLIRIQGTSAEPQSILQRLEQDPMFTDVVFSRATSNNRYYIDLRLAEVNFEAYRVRYFPDD